MVGSSESSPCRLSGFPRRIEVGPTHCPLLPSFALYRSMPTPACSRTCLLVSALRGRPVGVNQIKHLRQRGSGIDPRSQVVPCGIGGRANRRNTRVAPCAPARLEHLVVLVCFHVIRHLDSLRQKEAHHFVNLRGCHAGCRLLTRSINALMFSIHVSLLAPLSRLRTLRGLPSWR